MDTMIMNEKHSHRSLDWIAQGLDTAIVGARQTFESYLSGESNTEKLIECRRYLEEIHAAFNGADLTFATLLSEQLILLLDVVIKDSCINKDNAYQALLGGLLQLPNYLVRMRSARSEKTSDIIDVVNDIRAAANEPLMVGQNIFSLTYNFSQEAFLFSDETAKKQLNACQKILTEITYQSDNNRLLLNNLEQAFSKFVASVSVTDDASSENINKQIMSAVTVLIYTASNGTGQLSLATKYALQAALVWLEHCFNTKAVKKIDCEDTEQITRQLLFCIALFDSDTEELQAFKQQYQLLEALDIQHPSEALRLGTPDAETMEIVFDSLLSDLTLLKNSLEYSVESDSGNQSQSVQARERVSFKEMAAMASTIGYTLQIAQYQSLAEQLVAIEAELISLHSNKELIESEDKQSAVVRHIAEELYKVESVLHQTHLGVSRCDSEISVINETIHCVSAMVENLSSRQSAVQGFFDDAKFLNYEPCNDLSRQLNEAVGAMRIIGVESLVEAIGCCARYLQSNLMDEQDDKAAPALIKALQAIASYLDALKYNQQDKFANALSLAIESLTAPAELLSENQKITVLPTAQKPLQGDFDADITEIFLEEAGEVLASLNENIALWSVELKNAACMADIRRGFHTLKGSGRMAGAEHIGDAAWAIEALINRMTDGCVAIDATRIAMVAEAVEYMPNLIQAFERRIEPLAAPLQDLISRADQLAANAETNDGIDVVSIDVTENEAKDESAQQATLEGTEGEGLKEKGLGELDIEKLEIKELDIKEKDIADENNVFNISNADENINNEIIEPLENVEEETDALEHSITESKDVSGSDGAVEDKIGDTADKSVDDIIDDGVDDSTLQTIFINELEIQLSVINGYLESHAMDSDIYPSEAVERALHTIVGGARIANNPLVSELFAPAEILLCLIRKRCAISEDENNLLIKIHNWTLSQINSGGFVEAVEPNSIDKKAATDLIDELKQAVADDLASDSATVNQEKELLVENDLIFKASHFLQAWRAAGSPPAEYELMLSVLQQIEQAATDGEQTFIQQQCNCLKQLYQNFSDGGLHYQAYMTILNGHRDLEDMLDRIAAGQRVETSSTKILEELLASEKKIQLKIQRSDAIDDGQNSQAAEDGIDQEIVSIFLDESEDLIEAVEADVQQWLNNRGEVSYLKSLMRPLHTIKGGARMAGIESVGDISHEFETLLLSVSNGDSKTDSRFFKKVSQFVASLIDAVSVIRGKVSGAVEEDKAESKHKNVKTDEKRNDEMIRVPSVLLEQLVNLAGETSISRSLIEEQVNDFSQSTDEIDSTIQRLKEQLRRLEIEMEAQIEFRKEQVESEGNEEFDPLEMDRYSQVQQLSKSLVESASDLKDLKSTLVEKTRDMETSLVQQARINTRLQEGLMQTRTVPLSRHIVPRLRRIVRQVSGELDKPITFKVSNAGGELDRSMLERMVTPLEHVLRNAIDHGIESSKERTTLGKPEQGVISLNIRREGGDVVLELSDDGRGLDVTAIRKKALSRGLIEKNSVLSDEEVMRFIFAAGFSTAKELTQLSGRGVGMDVVQSEIADLGGSVELHSKKNQGTLFTFRVPFTVSMNRALLVSAGGERLAVPLDSIEGIVRVSPFELEQYYGDDATDFFYAGQKYDFSYLGHLINGSSYHTNPDMVSALPVLLVRGGDKFYALQVDRLIASREIVVKSLGAQFANLEGIAGATVLGDGSVVMIADLAALVRAESSVATHSNVIPLDKSRDHLVAMVVDDSVTVRKVTSRLLERRGMDVVTAKDGLDAMLQLEDVKPDFILLDIEMPRMDGFEVVTRIRNDAELLDIPIIMITSRTGEKHRERALSLGANAFLGKPYQEAILFDAINNVLPATVLSEQFGT